MKSLFQPAALTAIEHRNVNILWLFVQSIRCFSQQWRWFLQHTLVVYLPYLLIMRLSNNLIDLVFNGTDEVSNQSFEGFLASLLSTLVLISLMVICWSLSIMPIAHWAEQLIGGDFLDYRNALKLGFQQWKTGVYATFKVWLIIAGRGILLGLILGIFLAVLSFSFEEESLIFQIISSIIFLGMLCYILFLMMVYSFVPLAIALRNCSGRQALDYSRKRIAQTIPVRLFASYLLAWFGTSFLFEYLIEVGLGAIAFIKPDWLFSLLSILAALIVGFISHIFVINQAFLFLNTDYLRGRSAGELAIESDRALPDAE